MIRSCYEKRNFNSDFHRLTFALVGVATPSDLIQDERRTPFNIGKAIQLAGNGHKSTVNSVAFSPDGKTLASASYDSTIKLWNVATSKEISTLNGHKYSVNSVAFSPDGKTLASASDDNTIKLWSLDLDNLLARGCNYLKEYLATRDELRKKLCSGT